MLEFWKGKHLLTYYAAKLRASPVIVGMVLGLLAEKQMRRSLAIWQGDPWVFLQRPLSGSILVLTALLVIGPWVWRKVRHRP